MAPVLLLRLTEFLLTYPVLAVSNNQNCTTWFTGENVLSSNLNTIPLGWYIPPFTLKSTDVFEEMIHILNTKQFKEGGQHHDCMEYLTNDVTTKTSSFLQNLLKQTHSSKMALITNNNKAYQTTTANVVDKLTNIEVSEFSVGTLNDTILNNFFNTILQLQAHTVILLIEEAEWEIVKKFLLESVNTDVFWIRLSFSKNDTGAHNDGVTCSYELSITDLLVGSNISYTEQQENEQKIINAMKHKKTRCSKKYKSIIRAVSIIDSPCLVETPHEVSEFGNTVCKEGSFPCRKATDDVGNSWVIRCCAGYVIDVAELMFDYLGYDWTLYLVPDGFYGGYDNCTNYNDAKDCVWNGLVDELISDRADVALAPLTATSHRIRVIDFTEHIITTNIAVVSRNKPEELEFINWEFLKSLDWTLLLALLITLMIVCSALFTVEWLMRKMMRNFKKTGRYPTREAFSYGAGLTFQRDLAGKTPNRWATRIIAISYAVALTIIMSTYTANLTATNIADATNDFKGLKDEKIINPTPAFIYGIPKGTSTELFFKSHKVYSRPYEKFAKYHVVRTDDEGVANVFTGQLGAYISDYHSLASKISQQLDYCENLQMKVEKFVFFNSFGTQKNSKLTNIFSSALRELKATNDLDVSLKRWFNTCKGPDMKVYPFTFQYAGGMVLLVTLFLALAILVLLVESLYSYMTVSKKSTFSINDVD